MTNRETLMEELADLPAEDFYGMMADNHLTIIIDNKMCEDCEAMYNGCPRPDDDMPCAISTEDWLGMPSRHARLINTTK